MLKVDNNGQKQIAEDTTVWNEGFRIDLSSAASTYSKAKSYTTTDGHTVRPYHDFQNCLNVFNSNLIYV
ncbi:hypothetical protein DPMN_117915 [Dreissena polymorpha]|uniref:Uncharacterized protein n=1 Tax=Dreissena polymorpha TaxID=45954 RepID=A0A9D4GFT2_DREPO|nr:hypothetical protein DPMN_117915 [Dreissena polymorpha]